MHNKRSIIFIFLACLLISCEGGDEAYQTSVTWESEIDIGAQEKEELQRYFDILDADLVRIQVMYEEENFDEYLHIGIENSRLFTEDKKFAELQSICQRLGELLHARVREIESYQYLLFTHTSGRSAFQSFQHQVSFEDLRKEN